MDDDWVPCPFNSAHVLMRKRLSYHIVKCRLKYNGPPLDVCPYNATHYVPKGSLPKHYETCASFFHAFKENDLFEH